jgi:hypothetical protein
VFCTKAWDSAGMGFHKIDKRICCLLELVISMLVPVVLQKQKVDSLGVPCGNEMCPQKNPKYLARYFP